jgi:hypothetical protein
MSSAFWFWSHFLVGVLAVSTVVNFVKSNASLLDRLRRFAIVFFLAVFGVNHITSSNSKCILTTIENGARKKEGKEELGDFLPRYYETLRKWRRG